MGEFQDAVARMYSLRGYTEDLKMLALGLCEEAGEICAAVLDLSPGFRQKEGRVKSDLEHELNDCLTYLLAIANAAGIDLGV